MPTIEFEGNDVGPAMTAEVPEGGAMVDICDKFSAPIPFGCRGASCGTCRIEVLEGMQYFDAVSSDEAGILEMYEDGPERRLACQARVKAGAGKIRIKIVDG